ncbi:hypothetical protein TCAL_00443 [Tigriopus californicus]|uniref:Mannosidase endo-alpha n=2 Tax=Tigriopus californicus TaxID=6832 RepID=A0A553ND09_TIGCA|nr:hypothetical protein TCAL_00443 [Tigriopus californicus]|eukprot:TCALIF_00443-PA protein Name:"Similar to Manea Glycoprotein endo-alpha-1,2-mannosidase (Rattus norvegicus)" AED:0.10 eAED:0.10 QI:0/-1/0/1/-1/1/1/0/486
MVVIVMLLALVTTIVGFVFLFLNTSNLSSYLVPTLSRNRAQAVVTLDEDGVMRQKRPMVQFYPDNQNKLLFRKSHSTRPEFLSKPHRIVGKRENGKSNPSYEQLAKEWVVQPPRTRSQRLASKKKSEDEVSYDIHVFYYGWYTNPSLDGEYSHWNHAYLPNWNQRDHKQYPTGHHNPVNDDLGSNFYPELGAYSSFDPKIIVEHMKQIKSSGAGVLSVSWYPPGLADENGKPSDSLIPTLLDAAQLAGLKVCLHVEPYNNLNVTNFRQFIQYVRDHYWDHPAFYKRKVGFRELPMFYIYDSYRIPSSEWQRLFSRKGDLSVRDTDLDAIFIGLIVELQHRGEIKRGKFDGFYTYFAANGFSFGSSFKNWKNLNDYAQKNSLLFIPSVGPGYIDTRIRPWNGQTIRDRRNGEYYALGWRTLLRFMPKTVSITSFNEWHEGTQIEKAVAKQTKDGSYEYCSYEPQPSNFYLSETRRHVETYLKLRKDF